MLQIQTLCKTHKITSDTFNITRTCSAENHVDKWIAELRNE
jgi:hypothetical protein